MSNQSENQMEKFIWKTIRVYTPGHEQAHRVTNFFRLEIYSNAIIFGYIFKFIHFHNGFNRLDVYMNQSTFKKIVKYNS